MIRMLYSEWDGTQLPFSMDAEEALDELSRFMMEGLDAREALEWMRYEGFDLAGREFRVMGLEEMLQQLRQQAREMMKQFNMDHTFDEKRSKLEELLDREADTVQEQSGAESADWNDLQSRRDRMPQRLSAALKRFEDYEWKNEQSEEEYRELMESVEDSEQLEQFGARNRQMLQGDQDLSFDEALELMQQIEALSQLARDLLEGNYENLPMDQLRDMLGEEGVQSIMILRDLESSLEQRGYLRQGDDGLELTPRAIRKLGELALDDIYSALKRGGAGAHETNFRGTGEVCIERTKPYVFGSTAHIDALGTVRNALLRDTGQSVPIRLEPSDLQVFDTDQSTETTTVLLLDMSWSMSWSGRWPAAKRVAIAMDQLIRIRYPRDRFFIVGFYTRARELSIREVPELTWNMSDPFTNLHDGLRVAQHLIERNPSENQQIIVITDGQPTAYFIDNELRVEWPNGRGGISPRAVAATLREVRRVSRKGITINTFMLDDSPQLMSFVEAMTRINKGRAFYTTPDSIGQYVMVDYMGNKRRRIR